MLGRNAVVLLTFLASRLAMPLMANHVAHDEHLAVRTGLEQDEDAAQSIYSKRAVLGQDEDAAQSLYGRRAVSGEDEDATEHFYTK
ncbi:hypothetical protein PG997_000221 [Apiospora hydei]|uniref:Uncharacterized protein n=1 Tax=Apiospora hydei TaxID=1337664 RepID=A0ABR1XA64_9PEZI